MTNEERWVAFIRELKAYIEEHHHCPNKHCTLYNAQKYYRRKMKVLWVKRRQWCLKRCLG